MNDEIRRDRKNKEKNRDNKKKNWKKSQNLLKEFFPEESTNPFLVKNQQN
jgi:hypothetical protein